MAVWILDEELRNLEAYLRGLRRASAALQPVVSMAMAHDVTVQRIKMRRYHITESYDCHSSSPTTLEKFDTIFVKFNFRSIQVYFLAIEVQDGQCPFSCSFFPHCNSP